EDQIIAIFAGSNGLLDDLSNEDVKPFEAGLLRFVKDKYPDAVETIRTTKNLDKDTEEKLKQAFGEFTAQFKASK
ncbi:F0F1 ATP synthase subunit alpha, partial [Acinetobacter baumannii]